MRGGLLLRRDDELGLVHLLVDDGELLGGFLQQLGASAAVPGAAAAAVRREHAGGDGDEGGAEGQDGARTAPGGRALRTAPSASVCCAGPGEGAAFYARRNGR